MGHQVLPWEQPADKWCWDSRRLIDIIRMRLRWWFDPGRLSGSGGVDSEGRARESSKGKYKPKQHFSQKFQQLPTSGVLGYNTKYNTQRKQLNIEWMRQPNLVFFPSNFKRQHVRTCLRTSHLTKTQIVKFLPIPLPIHPPTYFHSPSRTDSSNAPLKMGP